MESNDPIKRTAKSVDFVIHNAISDITTERTEITKNMPLYFSDTFTPC